MLARCLASKNRRRGITRRNARRISQRLDEVRLKLGRIDPSEFHALRILRRRGHDLRPLLVKVDEDSGYRLALNRVGAEQLRLGTPVENRNEFPTEVERVLH